MKLLPQFIKVLIVLFSVSACAWGQTAATLPTSASAAGIVAATLPASGPAVAEGADALELRVDGINEILAGQFDKGIADLRKSLELAPNDKALSKAMESLVQYQSLYAISETGRLGEYNAAVARVERCMLAQKLLPELASAGIAKTVHQKAQDVFAGYNKIAATEALNDATPEEAAKLIESTIKGISEAQKASEDLADVAKLDKSHFSQTLLPLVKILQDRLDASRRLWQAIDFKTELGLRDGIKNLTTIQDSLADSISDVESMTSEEPWRLALLHARLAKQISLETDQMTQQEWYKSLVADAQARGKAAIEQAKWYDALNAYVALEELDDSNEEFRQAAKDVRTHVRVLRLYGGPDALKIEGPLASAKPGAASQPATTKPADVVRWQDMIEGVDAEMVRSAISKVNEWYVIKPDYRKVTRGGLGSIKVLASTPQAGYSFPKLKDDALRNEFLASIDRMLDTIEKKDNVDYLELQLALNNVLRASQKTVEIPLGVLAMEFCDGLLMELDKFSTMIWPHDVNDFEKQIMGRFCGIGIQIAKEQGEPLRVVTPLAGSPAFKAGIKTGDLVITVDGQSTDNMSLDKLVGMIMGEPGTKVNLMVKRRGQAEPFEMAITREEISIRTVKGWKYLPSGDYDYMIDPVEKIAYVRVSQFTDQTSNDLTAALVRFRQDGVRSLILDLRFNPGGLLRSAGTVSDEFLRGGRIVSTHGIQQPKATQINAQAGGSYLDGDLVVLVNEHSASAAEIVSGALKDWRRAIIVGERSYGKGSVQNVINIPRHRAYLKLTTAYYYLPSGRCLHRRNGDKIWGVDPDVRVLMTPRQMRNWLDIRQKTDLLKDGQEQQLDVDLADQYKADTQLNTAVMILKLMRLQEKKDLPAAPAFASDSLE